MPCCPPAFAVADEEAAYDMGLAPGGRMRQEIYDDPYSVEEYAADAASRCYVHLCNSMVWRAITGKSPPHTPPTAREYNNAGLPWFDYESGAKTIEGGNWLDKVESIVGLAKDKGEVALPENHSVVPEQVVKLSAKTPDEVSDGQW